MKPEFSRYIVTKFAEVQVNFFKIVYAAIIESAIFRPWVAIDLGLSIFKESLNGHVSSVVAR